MLGRWEWGKLGVWLHDYMDIWIYMGIFGYMWVYIGIWGRLWAWA